MSQEQDVVIRDLLAEVSRLKSWGAKINTARVELQGRHNKLWYENETRSDEITRLKTELRKAHGVIDAHIGTQDTHKRVIASLYACYIGLQDALDYDDFTLIVRDILEIVEFRVDDNEGQDSKSRQMDLPF